MKRTPLLGAALLTLLGSLAPKHDFWVAPLMWSIPTDTSYSAVNAIKLGQSMYTPSDLTLINPDPNDIPYSAIICLTNPYLVLNKDHADVVSTSIGSVGTLRSAASSSVILRYGRDLKRSFGNFLLLDSRTTNPIAVSGEWYVYAGLQAEYVFNEIFMDGNTYRDSASVDYDHSFVGLNYSWGSSSLTFAVNHSSLLQPSNSQYTDENRYGTLTYS